MEEIKISNLSDLNQIYTLQKNKKTNEKIDFLNKKFENVQINKNSKYDDKKIKEIASDFASLFIKIMLNELKNSLSPKDDILYGGFREEIWKDMLFDEYSKKLARTSLNSLSEMIYKSILRNTNQ